MRVFQKCGTCYTSHIGQIGFERIFISFQFFNIGYLIQKEWKGKNRLVCVSLIIEELWQPTGVEEYYRKVDCLVINENRQILL